MKRNTIAVLAGILLAGSVTPTFAQSLLDGVISGSNGDGLVTIGSGSAGSGGLVNVGLGDSGSGSVVDVGVGSGNDPIASVNVGSSGGRSGSVLDVDVGASNNSGGLLGVDVGGQGNRGNAIGVNVLTSPNGAPVVPGQPGTPGQPGAPGQPSGTNMVGSTDANSVGGFGRSSKVSFLARLLENRAWLRFASGNAICLPPAGIANVTSLVTQRDANRVNQLLGSYSGDIGNLRSLLGKCGNRTISATDVGRAITVDLRRDGTVVLYVL